MTNAIFFENIDSITTHDADQSKGVGEVCIANISPAERKKRMDFAVSQLLIGLVILLILILFGVNPLWRLLLFAPFSAAGTSYFQAKDKT